MELQVEAYRQKPKIKKISEKQKYKKSYFSLTENLEIYKREV